MSSLLVGLVVVLLVPLILSSWRVSLISLSLQGLLMGWWVLEEGRIPSLSVAILLIDLFVVRGLVIPLALYGVLGARGAAARNSVVPANLFSWVLAGAALFLALRFGRILGAGDARLANHLFVSAAAFLLGLLILGTQNAPFSQIAGLLRIENAIALFELASDENPPLPIQLGLLVVFVLSTATLVVFLRRLSGVAAPPRTSLEGPTL